MSTSVLVNREDRRSHSRTSFANMKLSMASVVEPPPKPEKACKQ
jgi:hypothetical protein